MIRKQRVIFILLITFLIGVQNANLLAMVNDKDTTVGYDSEKSYPVYFEMEVVVLGNGSVFDGTQEIRQQINVYQLKDQDEKKFRLKADKDNRIKSVIFNYIDISDQLNKRNEIKIRGLDFNTSLIITFEKDIKDTDKPLEPPIHPNPPTTEVKPPIKDIGTIITQEIVIDDLKDGITDELIRSYISSNLDYKILSHNIQSETGTYEILIQLEDGTLQTLEIEVVSDKEKNKLSIVTQKPCYIHYGIALMIIIYSLLFLRLIYKQHSIIKHKKERSNTNMKFGYLTATSYLLSTSFLLIFTQCVLDIWMYSFAVLSIIIYLRILYQKQKKIKKLEF